MGLGSDRSEQRKSERGSGRYKFKKGPNRIRIFTFKHEVTKADVKAGWFKKGSIGSVEEEFDRLLVIQFGVRKGPIIANEATLARYNKLSKSTSEVDQTTADKMKPQNKYAVNLVDVDERPYRLRQVLLTPAVDIGIWNEWDAKREDGCTAEEVFGASGRDFTVTYNPDAAPMDKYKVSLRDKDKSAKLPEELLQDVKDFYTTDGLAALGLVDLDGDAGESETDLDDEGEEKEEEEEKDSKPRSYKAAAKDDEDDD